MSFKEHLVNLVLSFRPFPAVTSAATLAAAPGDGGGEDRLSALPDDLRRNIVSHLPITDAVRTTALSTGWRGIWRSAPLVLYDQHIPGATAPEHVAAINSVLDSHPGPIPILTAHLVAFDFKPHEPELAEWSQILASRDVEDLVLITRPMMRMFEKLTLPADILRCEKLRRLELGFWAFPDTTNLPGGLGGFPDLQELAILCTHIADSDLDRMLDSSPALEKLVLATSFEVPGRVRLRGEKLERAIFCASRVVEIAVEAAPCLERLVMWDMIPSESEPPGAGVRIAGAAPALKVLGYLDTRVHQLRFGDNSAVITVQADTNPSPRSRVPSVKILAIKVDFNVFSQVQMLLSFLRCFPNVETLHVESAVPDDESTEDQNAELFENLGPIECVRFHITKVFLYGLRGCQSEMALLKYLALRAIQLQKLTLVLPYENLGSDGENGNGNNIIAQLHDLLQPEWASEACKVLLQRPVSRLICSFDKAFYLSIQDPFLKEDGEVLFYYMKMREHDVN
ncbi:unnamed protein product [Urochloa decumbens]|uniref:F-box domain-containing protein n=1 Tax=Urochloa decumbens TaxID=240449 RepID=A0ABC8Z754_9POAL